MLSMTLVNRRTSSAVEQLFVSLKDGVAFVTFKNGSTYGYSNVSRRAILNLMLNNNMSLGFWVNSNLCSSPRVKYAEMPMSLVEHMATTVFA